MRTGTHRLAIVAVSSLALVCPAAPAMAETPVSDEVRQLPTTLADDLSAAEERTLSTLTEGTGVRLEAFVETPDGPSIVTLDADARSDAAAAARVLDQQPSVDSAGLSTPVRVDAGYLDQYGNAMVRSEAARSEVDAGALSDVVVAVLDTGVAAHPELESALVPGLNFTDSPGGALDTTDRHMHGTHVAGTVGADAGSDVEGVASGVRIMPVKVLGDDGSGWSDWTANGIVWAADHGADVINMSLGGPGYSSVQASAIAYARSKGVTVVAAAGNEGNSTPQYPAADAGVVAVSAVDETDARAYFSNYGSYVDVAAPGVRILSTFFTGGYASLSGTSMASPHVAGVAALVDAAAPGLTPDQVEQVLSGTAVDLGPAGRDDVFGSGRVDALLAVRAAKALAGIPTPPSDPSPVVHQPSQPYSVTAAPQNGAVRVTWAAPVSDGGSPVTAYRVTAAKGSTLVRSVEVAGSTRTAVLTGLANGTAYQVGVEAVNAAGTGPRSTTVTGRPRTTPGAPKVASVTAKRKAVLVRWSKPAGTGGAVVSGYVVRVYSGGKLSKAVTVRAAASSATVTGLKTGKAYTFRVLARNAAGLGTASALSKPVKAR